MKKIIKFFCIFLSLVVFLGSYESDVARQSDEMGVIENYLMSDEDSIVLDFKFKDAKEMKNENIYNEIIRSVENIPDVILQISGGEVEGFNRKIIRKYLYTTKTTNILENLPLLDENNIIDFSKPSELYYSSLGDDGNAYNHYEYYDSRNDISTLETVEIHTLSSFFKEEQQNGFVLIFQNNNAEAISAIKENNILQEHFKITELAGGFDFGEKLTSNDLYILPALSIAMAILVLYEASTHVKEISVRSLFGKKITTIFCDIYLKDIVLNFLLFLITHVLISVLVLGRYRTATANLYNACIENIVFFFAACIIVVFIEILFIIKINHEWLKKTAKLENLLNVGILGKAFLTIALILPFVSMGESTLTTSTYYFANVFNKDFTNDYTINLVMAEDKMDGGNMYEGFSGQERLHSIALEYLEGKGLVFGDIDGRLRETQANEWAEEHSSEGDFSIPTTKYDRAALNEKALKEYTLKDLNGDAIDIDSYKNSDHIIFVPKGKTLEDVQSYCLYDSCEVVEVQNTGRINPVVLYSDAPYLDNPVIQYVGDISPQMNFAISTNMIRITSEEHASIIKDLEDLGVRTSIDIVSIAYGAQAKANAFKMEAILSISMLISYLLLFGALSLMIGKVYIQQNKKSLAIDYLHGKSLWKMYSELASYYVISLIFSSLVGIFVFKIQVMHLIIFQLLFTLLDISVIIFMARSNEKRHTVETLKG